MNRGFPPQHPVCPPPRVNAGYWYAFFVVPLSSFSSWAVCIGSIYSDRPLKHLYFRGVFVESGSNAHNRSDIISVI